MSLRKYLKRQIYYKIRSICPFLGFLAVGVMKNNSWQTYREATVQVANKNVWSQKEIGFLFNFCEFRIIFSSKK